MRYGLLFLLVCLPTFAEEKPGETPAAVEVKKLADEYQNSMKSLLQELPIPKNGEDVDEEAYKKYREKSRGVINDLSIRYFALAEKYPNDPAAVDALIEAVRFGNRTGISAKALAILSRDHLQNAKLSKLCASLGYEGFDCNQLLNDLIEKSPHREVRGQASFTLAQRLRKQAAKAKTPEDRMKTLQASEKLYQKVVKDYADLPYFMPGQTIGQKAQGSLEEINHFAIGQVAPEITGEDIDGKPLKLSDFRGKVIVLDFWGHWCPDCRKIYDHQKALVARYQGKPFVLLGINSDRDKNNLRAVLANRGVNWRYWWEGGIQGPIAKAWNIEGWPTLVVLDHQGVIRARGHEEMAESLPALLDPLVKEAEAHSQGK